MKIHKFIISLYLFMFAFSAISGEVKYNIDNQLGVGEITSGKLKICVNETGINGITIDEHELIGDIYPVVLGAKYKSLADNSKNSNIISKNKLKLIQNAGEKYILIRNIFGSSSNGFAVSERHLSLSPAGILRIKCTVDVAKITGAIAQQRIVTVMGRQYRNAPIFVNRQGNNVLKLNEFKGTFKNPRKIILSFGGQKWSFKASGSKNTVQLYKSYRRVINASVFSKNKLDMTLKYDFSQLLKAKLKIVNSHTAAKAGTNSIISGKALKNIPESNLNLLENASFESGLYAWRPVISTADDTWIVNRDNSRHGNICLKYTGTGSRHEGIYSKLYLKKAIIILFPSGLKGQRKSSMSFWGLAELLLLPGFV